MKEISAGAIVYTRLDNVIHYLLIRDNHGNYGFPKGHLEDNETDVEAAIREIKEETNIDITLDTSFKQELNYVMPNGVDKTAIYYLGYFENQKTNKQIGEVEEIILLPYKEALDTLTFNNMKEALIKAERYISNE